MMRFLTLVAVLLLYACAADETLEAPAELLEFQQQARFKEVWSTDVGDLAPALRLGLVLASDGQNVFVATHDGEVRAYDAASGTELWRYESDESGFWSSSSAPRFSAGPSVAQDRVAIGSLSGDVLLLSASTGELLWKKNVNGELLAPPLLAADLVVMRTTDGRVVALDTATGDERWDTVREVPPLVIRGLATPTTDGQRIFAGFDNGKVAALNIEDGSMIWEASIATPVGASVLESIIDVDGNLVQFGQEVYATSYNGHAAALAAESGEVLWRRELSSVKSPEMGWGNVYVTDVDSEVRAFDRLTGTSVWTQDKLRARSLSAPTVFGDLVVVGDFEGYLHFLDVNSGEMQARIEHDGEPIDAPPMVVGDLLVVLSGDGELAAYRRIDRKNAE